MEHKYAIAVYNHFTDNLTVDIVVGIDKLSALKLHPAMPFEVDTVAEYIEACRECELSVAITEISWTPA